jgi:hypothetical protein
LVGYFRSLNIFFFQKIWSCPNKKRAQRLIFKKTYEAGQAILLFSSAAHHRIILIVVAGDGRHGTGSLPAEIPVDCPVLSVAFTFCHVHCTRTWPTWVKDTCQNL